MRDYFADGLEAFFVTFPSISVVQFPSGAISNFIVYIVGETSLAVKRSFVDLPLIRFSLRKQRRVYNTRRGNIQTAARMCRRDVGIER
jgi:hypothetical protein